MLVLPLPHHSALRYNICYSSLHDSHDPLLFSTCVSPSPCSVLLFLLCPRLCPPPYPQGTPCALPALPAISAVLHTSLHCVRSLPLLHPCYSNPNTHEYTPLGAHLGEQHRKHTHTHTCARRQRWIPLSHFLLRTADPHQHTKLLPAECHFMTRGMVAPTALSSTRTHKNLQAHTHIHTHTLRAAHTNTLSPSPSVINQLLCCIQWGSTTAARCRPAVLCCPPG